MNAFDEPMLERYRRIIEELDEMGDSYGAGARLLASNAASSTRQRAKMIEAMGGPREDVTWLERTADELDKLAGS